MRSANGMGKGWLSARMLLWWCYARQGLAIVTAPTLRQARDIMMREIRAVFGLCPQLPGELFEQSLRIDDARQTGILAFTANEASRWQGLHHPQLMVVIDEGQGCEPDVFEAAAACQPERLLVIGNPLRCTGDFYRISQSDAWTSIKLSAEDHPNVADGGGLAIPGGITHEWMEQMAEEYGRGSNIYRARVLGEFPEESIEGLIQRAWLRAAFERHEQRNPVDELWHRPVVAVDPARFGADATAVTIVHGPAVTELMTWRGLSC